jgi:hypothetical protein
MPPAYCTREDVKGALDLKESARANAQIDRAIESASRSVEGLLRRKFFPQVATRYKDFPNYQRSRPWRLWLDRDEVVSVTTLVAGGTTIAATDYFLEPANSGPPYTRIEIDLASSAAFGSGSTHQRAIAITGVFGYGADEEPAGALAEALDAVETGVDVTDSAAVGVGTIIRVDSERMTVTEKSMLDTGQNLQASLTASVADVTVAVTSGSAFTVGETILIDSERMLVVDIAGNSLTVRRAWDGTVLAAHTAPTADIYAPRTLTVTRGALGTAAATHSLAAPVLRHAVPGLVRELCVAEALNTLQQEQSGYARVVGEGDTAIEVRGQGLSQIRSDALAAYGRRARSRAV